MAQHNPIEDRLKQENETQSLQEEVARRERALKIAKARFDPEGFMREERERQRASVFSFANQIEDRNLFDAAQRHGFDSPVQGTYFKLGGPLERQSPPGAFLQGTGADLFNFLPALIGQEGLFPNTGVYGNPETSPQQLQAIRSFLLGLLGLPRQQNNEQK